MKNKGLFRFDAGVRFSDYGNNTNINGLATKSIIKWEPSFATELRFSQQHSVAFGLSYKYVPTDIEALSDFLSSIATMRSQMLPHIQGWATTP